MSGQWLKQRAVFYAKLWLMKPWCVCVWTEPSRGCPCAAVAGSSGQSKPQLPHTNTQWAVAAWHHAQLRPSLPKQRVKHLSCHITQRQRDRKAVFTVIICVFIHQTHLAREPGSPSVSASAAASGRGVCPSVRPSVQAMADEVVTVSVERDSGDGGLAE